MSKRRKHVVPPRVCDETIVCEVGARFVRLGYISKDVFEEFEIGSNSSDSLEAAFSSFLGRRALSSLNSGETYPGSVLLTTHASVDVEFFFEKLNVARLSVCSGAVLALAARGVRTGLVVDSGECATRVTPVFEGYVQQSASKSLSVGGRDITNRLVDLLKRSDSCSFGKDLFSFFDQAKKQLCYIPTNIDEERHVYSCTHSLDKRLVLPDGCLVIVGAERFLAGEIMFHPKYMNEASLELVGVSRLIGESVESCAVDLRSEMLNNILLAGGNTCLRGFADRIRIDVPECEIDQDPDRQNLIFRGAKALAVTHSEDDKFWTCR